MSSEKNTIPQFLWEDFELWLMATELATEPTITSSILRDLYRPMITPAMFWERCQEVFKAYLALPESLMHLRDELYRYGYNSSYRLPHADLDPEKIAPTHAKFLEATNWYRNPNNLDDEFYTAASCIGMIQMWSNMFFNQALTIGEREMVVSLLFWGKLRWAVTEKNARLLTKGVPILDGSDPDT